VPGLASYLKRVRPARLPADVRSKVLASLPEEGEVEPGPKDASKLAAIDRILDYHDRDGAVDIKVIRVFQACVGFHARSVILISERALWLLSAEELQALAAHELGHDYFWDEYALARAQDETQWIRELELRCDGVAVITLTDLGLDPKNLISAINKIAVFNARFGVPSDRGFYPPEAQRVRFIETMVKLARKDFASLRGESR
jgi:Zn-dependent protease with chaperone function